ncbi:UNVERIFIED_CONTAM: hypothetical protein K2H54_025245, partial [Gekko kuhli]
TSRSMAMEEFQVAVHQGKLSDAISVVQAKPPQYFSNTPLNVAVVGEPGSGKSSFVNSILGKRPGELGAAETGIQTTTTKAKDYPLPMLQQVTLWDLPGREESYGSRIHQEDLNRFDFFIIVGYQRFRTVHAELAHEIQAMGKRFYFVRAKTDLDLEASRRRQPSGYDDQKVLQRIREDCMTCLQNESVNNPQVFLVSNWDPQSLDFPLLLQKLQSDLLWLKRQAFIFSLPSLAAPVLENKKAAMKGKIWVKDLFCGFLGLLPVPGISFIVAMSFFVKFRSQCYQFFGLDLQSLTALARDVGKPVAALQAVMTSKSLMPMILWRLPDLVGATLMMVEYCLWGRFPFAGCLVSGGSSFFTSYYMLHRCLTAVAQDTQSVLSRALEGLLWLKSSHRYPTTVAEDTENVLMKGKILLEDLCSKFLCVADFVSSCSKCYLVFGLDNMSLTALARDVGKPVTALQAAKTSKALPSLSSPVLENKKPAMNGNIWIDAS